MEPTVYVTLTPKYDTICDKTSISVTLGSLQNPTREARFRYTVIAPLGVTVLPLSGNNLNPGTVLNNSITNSNVSAQLVKFVVTPYTRHASGDLENVLALTIRFMYG
ncbi:MAG: hypothetical protein HC905_11990 [Bacteroidales bacterium]|nr:hypothetical protein [Bacteroidales bacterium]